MTHRDEAPRPEHGVHSPHRNENSADAENVVQIGGDVHGSVTIRSGRTAPGKPDMVPTPTHRVVPRPELVARIVDRLTGEDGDVRGVVTGLYGAGGFGKTTLAAEACRDPRVREHFPDGMLWVTIGERIGGAELASAVDELCYQLSGQGSPLTDPEQAGHHLGRLLSGKRCLLVVDDAWRRDQLDPFLLGGTECARLVTTRNRDVLTESEPVVVDAMTPAQATALLAQDLPDAATRDLAPLLERTGSWPVLLRLVNGALRRYVRHGAPVADAAVRVAEQLTMRGPAVVDPRGAGQRGAAVTATVEASLSALAEAGPDDLDRYLELAVFPEDAWIPQPTLEHYWAHTGRLDAFETERLCLDLVDASLVQDYELGTVPRIRLHDVIRSYLHHRLGRDVARRHRGFLDAHRARLPTVSGRTAWWDLPDDEPYLWRHLPDHLREAGLTGEWESLLGEFRWVRGVIGHQGPAAMETGLRYATSPVVTALRQAITQNTHLLAALEPGDGLAATLLSRLRLYPELDEALTGAEESLEKPALVGEWRLPDAPHPALRRTFPPHEGEIGEVRISPDGSWIAVADTTTAVEAPTTVTLWNVDGTSKARFAPQQETPSRIVIGPGGNWLLTHGFHASLRLWNTDGTPRAAIPRQTELSTPFAILPDGSGIVTGSCDGHVRTWRDDGQMVGEFRCHDAEITKLAISPVGSWIAVAAGDDPTVRLWRADGTFETALTGHTGTVDLLAISPDGRHLATTALDGTARLWSADGAQRHTFTEHGTLLSILEFSPDSSWVALGGVHAPTVWLWSIDGDVRRIDESGFGVKCVTIGPDSAWFATSCMGDNTGAVRIWGHDATWRTTLNAHTTNITALSLSPDGEWMTTGALLDHGVRLWDTRKLDDERANAETADVTAAAISPDGDGIVTGSGDGAVRLWDAEGTVRSVFPAKHDGEIRRIAVSPAGDWIATSAPVRDAVVRLWHPDGTAKATLTGHTAAIIALTASPDGTWLATAALAPYDGTMQLWSTDGEPAAIFRDGPDGSGITAIAVSPDGTWIATANERLPSSSSPLRLWYRDGAHKATLSENAPATDLAVSPDGHRVAAATGTAKSNTVELWDVAGRHLTSLRGHTGLPKAVAFSRDGDHIASGGTDSTVRVWDLRTEECVAALRVDGPIRQLAWFACGTRIAAVGERGLYVLRLIP